MTTAQMLRSPVALFLTIVSCVAAAPVQLGPENIGLSQAVYSQPELAEALARSYEALGEPEARRLVGIDATGHLVRQTRRGLDSLSGATFGESKRFDPHRKPNDPTKQNDNWPSALNRIQYENAAKRNFDEIDRTNFDSFVKRNFDEIDRTGWNSFVKRRFMDAYLASRQR